MSDFDPSAPGKSPDRMDALVWALTELLDDAGTGLPEYYERLAKAPKAQSEPVRLRVPQGMGAPTLEDGKTAAVDDAEMITVPAPVAARIIASGHALASRVIEQ
jgi:hypothetical protein